MSSFAPTPASPFPPPPHFKMVAVRRSTTRRRTLGLCVFFLAMAAGALVVLRPPSSVYWNMGCRRASSSSTTPPGAPGFHGSIPPLHLLHAPPMNASHPFDFHPSIQRDFKVWMDVGIGAPTSGLCQVILYRNGTTIMWQKDQTLYPSLFNKARGLDQMVRWVAERLPPATVPTAMCIHLGSTPVFKKTMATPHPIFALAKSDYHQDIVYPNMYFGRGDNWDAYRAALARNSRAHPHAIRSSLAFWRGTCGGYRYNKDRIALVLAGNETQGLLDVGFKNKCPMTGDPTTDAMLERVNAVPSKNFIRPYDLVKYKMQLNMPGSSKGSYSRHMQTALCCNSTTFLWDNVYYEFYYSLIKPWVHYIPVNATNLVERVTWAQQHPDEAEQIAAAGYEFCRTQLSSDALALYWLQLFTMQGYLQRFKVENLTHVCHCYSPVGDHSQDYTSATRCKYC